jgi:tape measure domain-containing protein
LSTLSQNNIVVNYVLQSDQIDKAKSGFDKLTDAEKKAVDETRKLNDQLKKTGQEGSESTKKVGNEMNNLTNLAKSGAGLLAGFFAVGSLVAFKDRLIETTIKFEGYSKAIQFGSGSAENFAKNQQFLNDLINKYGLGLASTTEAYKSFFNASTLAGQSQAETNRQFEAVTKAGTVLKLTADQMQGAFMALGQMMSKGTVQAEELRGQLGERIPGAFSIMAKALGVNERQLNKMLEQGQVLSKDALPAFAAELEKTFGGEAEKNLNGMVNTMNRFYNSIDRIYIKLGESKLGSVIEREVKIWTGYFDFISEALTSDQEKNQKKWDNRVKAVEQGTKKEIELEKVKYNEINKANASSGAIARGILNKEAKDYEYYKMRVKFFNLQEDKANLELFEKRRAILLQTIEDQENANKKKVASKVLTDAETKALKAQYDARLKLLELEKRIAEIKIQLSTEEGGERDLKLLRNAENFGKQKLSIDKKYADLGLVAAQENAKVQTFVVRKQTDDIVVEVKKQAEEGAKQTGSVLDQINKQKEENAKFEAKKRADQEESIKSKEKTDKEIVDLEQQKADAIKDIDEKSAKEKKKLKKELAEMDAELIQASFDLAVMTTNGLFNLQSQYAANEMVRKQKQFDEEIRLADGNVQKINEIEERRRAAEKEYREKEFRANQAQAIANIIFAAAPEIVKNIKNPALLALIIGGAAIQTGLVLAQPVPEFAEGTKGKAFKGKAIVGEKGTELVTTLSGKQYYTPPTATLAQFDEPVHITPNHLLGLNDRYLSSQYFNNSGKKDSSGMQIVTKLEAIENGLKNMPVAAISLDEKGFMKKVRTPNRSTTILNNRYKN